MKDIFTILKRRFEKVGGDATVTKRTLSLGSQDSDTGWFAKTYSESSDECIIVPRGRSEILTGTGKYVRKDALGFTKTEYKEGDEVKDVNEFFYLVVTVTRWDHLGTLLYYELDLVTRPDYLRKVFTVTFSSEATAGGYTNEGTIDVDGSSVGTLPAEVDFTVQMSGTYSLDYNLVGADTFDHWVATGDIDIDDVNDATTGVRIRGDGTIKAVYVRDPCR